MQTQTFREWLEEWFKQNEANQPRIIMASFDGVGIPYFEEESAVEMERRTR